MRVASIVGTRPQLIKAAAVEPLLRARYDAVLIDTGQHWSDRMAHSFMAELGLPRPDHSLGAGGGSGAVQIADMLAGLEPIVSAERPDVVVVYGDTNSTLAGALAAAKSGIPLAHIEAGLRSFDRRMPEEVNRVVVDHLSTLLFAPSPLAVGNLAREGIASGVVLTGDVMQDLAARFLPEVREPTVLDGISGSLGRSAPGLPLRPGRFLYATVHRAENREVPAMRAWSRLLERVARPDRPVVLALHPGTAAALAEAGISLHPPVIVVEPLGYRGSLALQLHAAAVLTDSGGIQREAAWLGVPCLVLRRTTEWTEAMEASQGTMVLSGLDAERATAELDRLAPPDSAEETARERATGVAIPPSGAARAIVETLGEVRPTGASSQPAGGT